MKRSALVAAMLISLPGLSAAAAENEIGRIAFNTHCRNCHSSRKGDNRLAPSLYGIVGSMAGQVAGYRAYSGSITGFRWDEATLDRFIANPRSVAPTTTMNYPPVWDPAERAEIIDFLKRRSSPEGSDIQ
jgi:cytochrome c